MHGLATSPMLAFWFASPGWTSCATTFGRPSGKTLSQLFPRHRKIFLNFKFQDAYCLLLSAFSHLNRRYELTFINRRSCGLVGSERRRFLFYCLYAFGGSIAVTGLVYLGDNTDWLPDDLKVQMASGRCWIKHSAKIEFFYVYLPITLVLVFNTFFYSITAYKIYRVQKETSIFRQGDSGRHSKIDSDKARLVDESLKARFTSKCFNRFFLYLRLFIVMGVTWIVEIVSWAFTDSEFLHLVDIFNCLQGIIIFVLFVWKPKVKKMIRRRWAQSWKF